MRTLKKSDRNFSYKFIMLAIASLMMSGCAAKQHTIAPKSAPEWVNKGGGWITTQNAGKRIFAVFTTTIFKEYQDSSGKKDIARSQTTVSEASLLGVLITERWIDPDTNTYYSLAQLDLNWVLENLGGMQIAPELKDFVRQKAFSQFDTSSK